MPAKTRDELRELVRTQLDMDEVELPDTLLDPWLEDGFERSLAVEDRWPFLEAEWTITTVADQIAYSKTELVPTEIDQIVSLMDITDAPFELQPISHDRAKTMFGLGAVTGGVSAYWSEWGGNIMLWPAPSVGRSVRVDGYRKPEWGTADADEPDCDGRLHICLFYFACAIAYAQQEDEVLSAEYLKHWEAGLRQAHKKIMALPQRRPIILSGSGMSIPWSEARLVP